MSKMRCFKRSAKMPVQRQKQRGDMLLEALIAMVLLAVVGVGPAFIAARMAVSHQQMNTTNNAVLQLRNLLLAQGGALCGTTQTLSLVSTSLPVTIACSNRSSVSIGGKTLEASSLPSRVVLSVQSSTLFGGDGSIVVGE